MSDKLFMLFTVIIVYILFIGFVNSATQKINDDFIKQQNILLEEYDR